MKLTISTTGFSISIDVLCYENDSPSTTEDAQWLLCETEVDAKWCNAKLPITLRTVDFGEFKAALRLLIDKSTSEASLSTLDDACRMAFRYTRDGGIEFLGNISSDLTGSSVAITWLTTVDQSYLGRLENELGFIQSQFPIR